MTSSRPTHENNAARLAIFRSLWNIILFDKASYERGKLLSSRFREVNIRFCIWYSDLVELFI